MWRLCIALLAVLAPALVRAQSTRSPSAIDTLPPTLRILPGWPQQHAPPWHTPDTTLRLGAYRDSLRTIPLPGVDSVLMQLDAVHRWDEALDLPGFVQHTGIIGKPVQLWHHGLAGRHASIGLWTHGLTGQPNPYFLLPEHTPVFDARKPLVHVHFNQSSFNTQLLRVTLSQNLRPWYNTTLHYRRRTATGLYASQVTDHYNLYWNHWLHSRDYRWQLFGGLLWQQLNDGLNGGIATEGGTPLADLFEGISTPVQLSSTQLYQRHRAGWVRAYGRLLPGLWLSAAGQASDFSQVLADPTTYTAAALNSSLFRPYPQLLAVEGQLGYGYTYRQYQGTGALRWEPTQRAPLLKDALTLEGEWRSQTLPQPLLATPQAQLQQQTLRVAYTQKLLYPGLPDTTLPALHTTVEMTWADNSLQAPVSGFQTKAVWQSRPRSFRLLDSTAIDTLNYRIAPGLRKPKVYAGAYAPWFAGLSAHLQAHNPSLQDAYWQGQTFRGIDTLQNELVATFSVWVGHRWGAPRMRRGLAYRQNYLQLKGFASALTQPIYYTDQREVRQATEDGVQWVGVQLALQQRLGRLYLQTDLTAQQGQARNGNTGLDAYVQAQPAAFGHARLFWEAKLFRTPADFQMGVEGSGFTAFRGLALDPSLQVWFPQYSQQLPAALQLNAWFALRIQRTFIYLKLLHANQGLPAAGYFTTPFHPMQPRAFTFGVSWQFAD